jgi:hypothetical protein
MVTQPTAGENICDGSTVTILCPDQDMSYVSFDVKSIPKDLVLAMTPYAQQWGGDADGDPGDGNLVSAGEYGNYCCGPAAAAVAIKYWYDRGYDDLLLEGGSTILDNYQLLDRLYAAMKVRDNLGTYDPEFVSGLRDYIITHSTEPFEVSASRAPKMADLLAWVGDYEYAVMLGTAGTPGLWITVSGMAGLPDQSGQYTFHMANPVSGTGADYRLREDIGGLWISINSVWLKVDLMVAMAPTYWQVMRTAAGVDYAGDDGWGFDWSTGSLSENQLHFLHVGAFDLADHKGMTSVLTRKNCSSTAGDVNDDGAVNLADLAYLINYLTHGGPVPPSGRGAADVNCDDALDLSDIVYFYNYLFLTGPPPCQ